EQGVGWSSIGRAVAELQRPETIDGERVTLRVHELAQEITAGIEGIDAAIAEVSNQYVAGELAKIRRRLSQAPGRVEHAVGSKTANQGAVGIEYVDETIAGAGLVIMLLGQDLLGEGDEQLSSDVLNTEGSKVRIDIRIRERIYQLEVLVKDLNHPCVKICGKEQVALGAACDRQALVDSSGAGIVHSDYSAEGADFGVPTQDGSIFGCKQEDSRLGLSVCRDGEVLGAVEHQTGRRAARGLRR